MEMYRQCGVEAAIRKAGLPPERTGSSSGRARLAGEEIERRVPWRAGPQSVAVSPVRNCLCAQDDLEPVLRRLCRAAGAAASSVSAPRSRACDQDETAVTATLDGSRERRRDRRCTAQYVIAADGAQSRIRQQLGVR